MWRVCVAFACKLIFAVACIAAVGHAFAVADEVQHQQHIHVLMPNMKGMDGCLLNAACFSLLLGTSYGKALLQLKIHLSCFMVAGTRGSL